MHKYQLIVTAILFPASALVAAKRFPYLNRLPNNSFIRQKCLNCPNNFFVRNGSLQDACGKLEEHVQSYTTSKGGWQYKYKGHGSLTTLEEEALRWVNDDFLKHRAIIMRAAQPEIEEYALKKGIGLNDDIPGCLGIHSLMWYIDARETILIQDYLFKIEKYKYKAENASDETSRQKYREKASELEKTFTTADNTSPDTPSTNNETQQ